MSLALVKPYKTGTIFSIVDQADIKQALTVLAYTKSMSDCLGVEKFLTIAKLKIAGFTDKDIIKVLRQAHHDDKNIISLIQDANTYINALKAKGKL